MARRMSTEEFKKLVYDKYDGKVEILSEYIGRTDPVYFVYHCEKHGDTYKYMNAKNVSSNKQFQPCKKCMQENKSKTRKTKDQLLQELKNKAIENGGVLLDNEWVKSKHNYRFKCSNPEHPIFEATHDAVCGSKESWCPYCAGRRGDFNSYYKKLIESKNGEMLDDYSGTYNHIRVRCLEQDWVWNVMPLNLKKGRWCPICSMPKSEIAVFDYLRNNKYNFEMQYTFDDLKSEYGEPYKFDFAIKDEFDKLILLIESDGYTHKNNESPESYLYSTFLSDNVKNRYCEDNDITLVRIEHEKEWTYDQHYEYVKKQFEEGIDSMISEGLNGAK